MVEHAVELWSVTSRDASVAIAPILDGQHNGGLSQSIFVFTLCRLVALRATWLIHQAARPPLTHALYAGMVYCTTPSLRVKILFTIL
jgi:hypothetical protein